MSFSAVYEVNRPLRRKEIWKQSRDSVDDPVGFGWRSPTSAFNFERFRQGHRRGTPRSHLDPIGDERKLSIPEDLMPEVFTKMGQGGAFSARTFSHGVHVDICGLVCVYLVSISYLKSVQHVCKSLSHTGVNQWFVHVLRPNWNITPHFWKSFNTANLVTCLQFCFF